MAFARDIIAAGIIHTTYPDGKSERRVQASGVPNAQMCFWGHPNETIVFKMYDLPHPVRDKREAVDLMLDMPQFSRDDKAWLKQVAAGQVPMQAERGSGKSRQHIPAFRQAAAKAMPTPVPKRPPAKSVSTRKRTTAPELESQLQAAADQAAKEAREKILAANRALTGGNKKPPSKKKRSSKKKVA